MDIEEITELNVEKAKASNVPSWLHMPSRQATSDPSLELGTLHESQPSCPDEYPQSLRHNTVSLISCLCESQVQDSQILCWPLLALIINGESPAPIAAWLFLQPLVKGTSLSQLAHVAEVKFSSHFNKAIKFTTNH